MAIDYYKIFALPKSYALDAAALEQNYRRLSTQYHPDKTAHLSAFEQKQAVMLSATINEAYRILKSPLDRAAYLLQEQGIHADAPENTRFEAAFLMQQMQWREDLDDAGHDENALLALNRQIVAARDALQAACYTVFKRPVNPILLQAIPRMQHDYHYRTCGNAHSKLLKQPWQRRRHTLGRAHQRLLGHGLYLRIRRWRFG